MRLIMMESCDEYDGSGAGPERSPTLYRRGEWNSVELDVLGLSNECLSTFGIPDEINSDVQDAEGVSNECLPTTSDNVLESADMGVSGSSKERLSTTCDCDELKSVDSNVSGLSKGRSSTFRDCDELENREIGVVRGGMRVGQKCSLAFGVVGQSRDQELSACKRLRTSKQMMDIGGCRGSSAGVDGLGCPVQTMEINVQNSWMELWTQSLMVPTIDRQ